MNASMKLLKGSGKKGMKVLATDSLVIEKINKTEEDHLKKWKWMEKVVQPKRKTLLHYDSLDAINSGCKELFFTSMRKLLTAKKVNLATWRDVTPLTPQQDDSKSCGVYVIKVAESVVNGKDPSISKDEIIKYRYQIAANLLKMSHKGS
ncbi:hypothetical protein OS493_035339 [Desmophyllum pertusum]|uniref:Ubiquitin-like protease family profile domain-containing protein n=1 Tax=Desmophyllum pertusum TaxID=174260 RepID=A0A9W9Y7P7_9CNID|nr:hypothetical protein OS493_035339 [Desmophyllum pertusum]